MNEALSKETESNWSALPKSQAPSPDPTTRPALRAVLISGVLMFVASAAVMVSLHRPARAGDADR